MNTLLEIKTDEGVTVIGSCFASLPLVEASLTLLKPMSDALLTHPAQLP